MQLESYYKFLLRFYPEEYREEFGSDILILYHDLEQRNPRRFFFLLFISFDTCKSALYEYFYLIQKKGLLFFMKQSLFTKVNSIAGICLLPVVIVFCLDFIGRVMQGNLSYPNPGLDIALSHSIFYQRPILITWILVLPIIAVVIECIGLLTKLQTSHGEVILFIKKNIPAFIVLFLAIGIVLLIPFHDFAPCMIKNVFSQGVGNLATIVSMCNNA